MEPNGPFFQETPTEKSPVMEALKLKCFMVTHTVVHFVSVYKRWLGVFIFLGAMVISVWYYLARSIHPLPIPPSPRPEASLASVVDQETVDLIDPGTGERGVGPQSPFEESSAKSLDEAVVVEEHTPEGMRQVAYELIEQRAFDEAIHGFESYIRQMPHDVRALYTLGRLYGQKGDKKKALEMIGRILHLQPHHSGAHIQRVLMEEASTRDVLSQLEAILSQVDSPREVWGEIGRHYGMLGDWDAAIVWTQKALDAGISDVRYFYNLATFYDHKGMYPEASTLYRRCEQLSASSTLQQRARERLRMLEDRALRIGGRSIPLGGEGKDLSAM